VTPLFVPVATQGAVRHLGPDDLAGTGSAVLLVDALHLGLRPGIDVVSTPGELHRFMGWTGPLITMSGSFRLRSAAGTAAEPTALRIDDAGATVVSHVDGARIAWSPERSIGDQHRLGADIVLASSQQTWGTDSPGDLHAAVNRTLLWNERSLSTWSGHGDMFGVVQGGVSIEERQRCAAALSALPFRGFAVGGHLGVGPDVTAALRGALGPLPEERPRAVLTAPSLRGVLDALHLGADLVSASFPIELAERGTLLIGEGLLDITDGAYAWDLTAPVAGCSCVLCSTFTRAYLHHLFVAHEMLAPRLAGIHNLHTVHAAVAGI